MILFGCVIVDLYSCNSKYILIVKERGQGFIFEIGGIGPVVQLEKE